MKAKTFIVLFVVFCLLAGVAYFSLSDRAGGDTDREFGQRPYADLPVGSIEKILVKSSDGEIHLEKTETFWAVEEKFGFPADFSAIIQTVSGLKSMKIGRSFQASENAKTRLGLHLPGEKGVKKEDIGIQVIMKNGRGEVLLDAVMGKTREITAGAGGHYILATPKQTIYLGDTKFDAVGKTALDWIEKDILDMAAEKIQSVSCFTLDDDKPVYTLRRPERKKAPELADDPAAGLDPSKIDDVFTALAPLTIEDVAGYAGGPVEDDISAAHAFDYRMFDGESYRFVPGTMGPEKKRKFVLKIVPRDGSNTHDEPDSPDSSPVMNQVLHKWVYQIPEWKFKRFIADRQALLQSK